MKTTYENWIREYVDDQYHRCSETTKEMCTVFPELEEVSPEISPWMV